MQFLMSLGMVGFFIAFLFIIGTIIAPVVICHHLAKLRSESRKRQKETLKALAAVTDAINNLTDALAASTDEEVQA